MIKVNKVIKEVFNQVVLVFTRVIFNQVIFNLFEIFELNTKIYEIYLDTKKGKPFLEN